MPSVATGVTALAGQTEAMTTDASIATTSTRCTPRMLLDAGDPTSAPQSLEESVFG